MANKKRRCTSCKKYKEATKGIIAPIGFFCDKNCRYDYATKQTKTLISKSKKIVTKKKDVEFKQRKTKFDLSDIPKQHKLTQKAFNRLRVLQELNWFKIRCVEPYCISCGKTNMDWCCGHYKTRGSQGNLRYDVMNTYLQCNRYCNMALSGNISGNKNTHGYEAGLSIRFGGEDAMKIMDYCENNTAPKKWTGEELSSMRKEINQKIRDLENELI